MRLFVFLAAALFGVAVASPAAATTVLFTGSGTGSLIQYAAGCNASTAQSPLCRNPIAITTGIFSLFGSATNEEYFNVGTDTLSFGLRGPSGCPLTDCYLSGTQGGFFSFQSFNARLSLDQLTFSGSNFNFVRGGPVDGTFVAVGLVPEPSTWAMMLIGFAAIGMALRGTRRSSSRHFGQV